MKKFDDWNRLKKIIQERGYPVFHERDVWFCNIGENIGYEQSGPYPNFVRPVIVLKKFNKSIFWAIPLTKTQNDGRFYHRFCCVGNVQSVALLSQISLIDARRLLRKIAMMSCTDYDEVIKKISKLLLN